MNAEQDLTLIVDKLAEKLGVAVEKLTPMANVVIEQYVKREFVWGLCCIGFSCLSIVLAVVAWKLAPKDDEDARQILRAVSLVICLIIAAILLGEAADHFGHWMAPLPSLLKL